MFSKTMRIAAGLKALEKGHAHRLTGLRGAQKGNAGIASDDAVLLQGPGLCPTSEPSFSPKINDKKPRKQYDRNGMPVTKVQIEVENLCDSEDGTCKDCAKRKIIDKIVDIFKRWSREEQKVAISKIGKDLNLTIPPLMLEHPDIRGIANLLELCPEKLDAIHEKVKEKKKEKEEEVVELCRKGDFLGAFEVAETLPDKEKTAAKQKIKEAGEEARRREMRNSTSTMTTLSKQGR